MVDTNTTLKAPLEARSPFELRVSLAKDVPEADVRSALATATWASFIRSRPVRPSMARAYGWWHGRPAVCGGVSTAITRTPGR